MSDPTLSVVVHSREGLLFEGPATSVSSTNKIGPFDVLPLHANFVCVLEKELIIRTPAGAVQTIAVPRGILKVKNNIVEVYVGV